MAAASAPICAFLEFFEPVLRTIFSTSHWLVSLMTVVETTENGERGMNPVASTIINPGKEYWPSGDQTSNLLSQIHNATNSAMGLGIFIDTKPKYVQ